MKHVLSTRKRISATALAASALVLGGAVAPATGAAPDRGEAKVTYHAAEFTDLQLDKDGPFDGAYALGTLIPKKGKTVGGFAIIGAKQQAWGKTFGVHLHEGPCVEGDGDAAGPHYNVSDEDPPVVNRQTEMWMDTTIYAGFGIGTTKVPFVPEPGERSIVVHEKHTGHDGSAGARLACIPMIIK